MSNLLQKASIVTTPTAYGVGVLNSIKPAQSFGEELIVNGTFDTDSNWNYTTSWEISNGKANFTNISSKGFYQPKVLDANKTYKVSFDYNGTGQVGFLGTAGGSNTLKGFANYPNGNNVIYITPTTTTSAFNIWGNWSGAFSIDNVSVKEVTNADFDFTRNSSATRVNPDYLIQDVSILSSNLVQNGNFSELGSQLVTPTNSLSNWIDARGNATLSIVSNSIRATITSGTTFGVSTAITTIVGKTYSINAKGIKDNTNGDFLIRVSNVSALSPAIFEQTTTNSINVSASGTFVATSTTSYVGFLATSQSVGDYIEIDNISVKQVDPNNYWILGTGWSFGDGVANAESGTGSKITQTNTLNGKKCKVTLTVSNYGGSGLILVDFGSVSSSYITSNGTHTVTGTYDANNFEIFKTADFAGSVTNISVIEIQQTDIPRLDYTNGTASILLEPQSTNLITYSEDFSQWSTISASVTDDYATSPEGITNASRFLSTSTGAYLYLSGISVSNSTEYTISVYAKSNGNSLNDFRIYTSIGDSSTLTATSQWQRFTYTFTTSTTSINIGFRPSGTQNADIQIYGYQIEEGSYSTSYIPTNGSAVTRAAETLNNAGNSDLINSTEGVLYAEMAALANDSTNRNITLSDSTDTNRIVLKYDNQSNVIQSFNRVGGVETAFLGATVSDITQFSKIAIKFKENDYALWIDGVEVDTDNSSTTFPANTLNDLSLPDLYARVKCLAVFKEALSDTELACLTSTNNREIFLNYYYRMQYVGANTEALSCAEQTFNI